MDKTLPLITTCLVLVLTACASMQNQSKPRPDWVDGESRQYVRTQYITGRGQADTLIEAENRARANIAKTFQVAVHEESTDIQQFKQTSGENGDEISLEAEIQRQISTETDQIIAGIEIADVWQDPASKTHHAFAILPRRQAASRLRQQIESLDKTTQTYIQEARESKDSLAKAGYATKAFIAQEQRAALQQSMQIIDVTGRGIKPQWEPAQLKTYTEELLARLHIKTQSKSNDDADKLTDMLDGGLAAAGMTPSNGKKADYILEAQFQFTDMGIKEEWQWARGILEIKLIDKGTKQVRGTKQWQFKVAALNMDEAKNRIYEKAESKLKKEMRDVITGFSTQ